MKSSALSELGRRAEAPAISWLMKLALSHPRLISLAAGFTDNESLPLREARELLCDVLRSRKTGLPALQYGMTAGDPVLRRLAGRSLAALDGLPASSKAYSPGRTIITSGSQQLLYITVEALCNPDDIVLVEDPTYFVFLGMLQARGVATRGVQMDRDGLNPDHLERVLGRLKRSGRLRRVKMLYLVSYFQNPTGVTTSFEKKSAMLKLLRRYEEAAGHPIYLLEDAAYRELRFSGKDVKSALAANGGDDRVIYAGTYSKPFATGVRVGFGVLPESIHETVLRIKGNHDFGTANLLQQLLARAVASGKYKKHLTEIHARYARKARVMHRALKKHFPACVEVWEPTGGLYFWARLPRSIQTGIKSKLFRTALANDVLYVPGELCYADDPTRRKPNHEMRISFGAASEANIKTGIARLGRALRELMDG